MIQVLIVLFSCSAIWFVGRKDAWSKWGFILGLMGQPFWLYETYNSKQWGIFVLSIWYTYAWGQGVYNHFIKVKEC